MKILFIGDVVGSPGRKTLHQYLPQLKKEYRPTITVINGENSAGGKGITEKIYRNFLSWGIQAITLGNHAWNRREIFSFIDDAKYLLRPANFPKNNPGQGMIFVNVNGQKVALINLQGRTFMPTIDDPFRKVDELIELAKQKTNIIFIDFHAEATSEKQALAWYVDGRVSAVVGTHTHVQTADERILPEGTGYITDVGMTGPYDSIIGVEREAVIKRFLTQLPVRFEVDESGRTQLNGIFIKIDPTTGKTTHLERIFINEDDPYFT